MLDLYAVIATTAGMPLLVIAAAGNVKNPPAWLVPLVFWTAGLLWLLGMAYTLSAS